MSTRFVNWVLLVLFSAISTLGLAAEKQSLSSYRLGSGDLISIQVLGEDDLRRERVRLSDAGTISFPVLGELQVTGITVGELESNITKGLKGRYLQNPVVTVTIHEYPAVFRQRSGRQTRELPLHSWAYDPQSSFDCRWIQGTRGDGQDLCYSGHRSDPETKTGFARYCRATGGRDYGGREFLLGFHEDGYLA